MSKEWKGHRPGGAEAARTRELAASLVSQVIKDAIPNVNESSVTLQTRAGDVVTVCAQNAEITHVGPMTFERKVYRGLMVDEHGDALPRAKRTTNAEHRVTVNDAYPLSARNDLFNHSPDGFSWGYGGSGPAQLALALLADCLGNDVWAVKLHQEFKALYVAAIPQADNFEVTGSVVVEYVRDILRRAAAQRPLDEVETGIWHAIRPGQGGES